MRKFIIEAFVMVEKLCNSKIRWSSHCQENVKPLNLVMSFSFSVPLFFFLSHLHAVLTLSKGYSQGVTFFSFLF